MSLFKQIVEPFLSISSLMMALSLAGILLSFRRAWSRTGRSCLIANALIFLVVFCSPLAELLLSQLEAMYPPLLKPELCLGARYILVLSAYGVESSSTPITSNLSEETMFRLVEGIRIYHRVPGSRIVVAGGKLRKNEKSLGELMADFLISQHISPEDIITERFSRDTYQNLENSRQWIGREPFFLVTSAYHLRRAMAVAKKLGMNPIASPAFIETLQLHPPYVSASERVRRLLQALGFPSRGRLTLLERAIHEHVGFLWYRLTQRV